MKKRGIGFFAPPLEAIWIFLRDHCLFCVRNGDLFSGRAFR